MHVLTTVYLYKFIFRYEWEGKINEDPELLLVVNSVIK